MTHIVKTTQLTKSYMGNEVVSNVNMNIKNGEIYGFLGPNGAGKTTVMKMITNLVKPTGGTIELFGEKVTNKSYHILGRIGSIIEYPIFYEKLTARKNLELHCEYMGFHNKQAIDEAMDIVRLIGIEGKAVKDFSIGMKQRLAIARAIVTGPELLILDEPINGLDPVGIKEIRTLFKRLNEEYGITILLSSHILGEVEQVADTIGVINQGKLIEEVALTHVREKNTNYIEITTTECTKAASIIESVLNITNFRVIDHRIIRIYDTSVPQSEISKTLALNDIVIESIHKQSSSLEDYFLTLLNGGEIGVQTYEVRNTKI